MMKYSASILTALALAGIGWAIVSATRPMPGGVLASDISPALSQQLKASDGEVLHLRRLEKTLDQVNRLKDSTQAPAAMLALYSSQPQTSAMDGRNQPVKPEISLVYISPDLQKVVINGRLLGTGDTLPDGGRLISITQEQIVVERNGHRKALRLPKPHVLGMEPSAKNAR